MGNWRRRRRGRRESERREETTLEPKNEKEGREENATEKKKGNWVCSDEVGRSDGWPSDRDGGMLVTSAF